MSLFSKLVIATTRNRAVRRTITQTDPGRFLAHRFVAGDRLDDAVPVARMLNDQGLEVSLDLLGEEVHDRGTALSALDGYLESIERIATDGVIGNVSIKLTQLGLAFDQGLAGEALDRLATLAASHHSTVTVDMEDSRSTQATVDLYADAQSRHGNLGVCVQAYLRRTPEDLERLIPLGGHIRLCKGAYMESDSIAYQGREDVNAAYAGLLERLMKADAVKPAIATHDDRLIDLTKQLATHRSAPWEFQMLYGVRPNLQTALAGQGHAVRVYVPFGSEWYPYLTRRLAERPANSVFFVRALIGKN